MSLVISLVLLGLGIGQRTIWAPPETIVSQLEQTTDAQIIVVPGETMNQHDGRQTVTISGDGPVTAVVGREHDVLGWVGEDEHALAVLDDEGQLTLESFSGPDEPLPALIGNDMWIEEHTGDGEVQFEIDLPVGFSMAIQGEPGTAAPADVRVEWPFDAKTPLFGPLITAGLIFLALALLLFLLALRRHRRRRGPQRRSHRDLSRAERRSLRRDARDGLALPESGAQGAVAGTTVDTEQPAIAGADGPSEASSAELPSGEPSSPSAPTPDGEQPTSGKAERRAAPTRRRFGLIALPVLASIALTGCGPQYWPSPAPSETSAAPTPTSLEETLPQVAITESQFERVLADTRESVAQADADRDFRLIERRVAGPMLEARRTNYAIRGQSDEIAALPGIPDGDVQLLLPQQTESWPRTVMAVVAWEDTAQAQSTLVFEQPDPRQPYRVVYQTSLASGVQVPAVASPTIGAASLPDNTPLLQRPAREITMAYADVLLRGDDSEYASWFREEGDALREQFGKAWKDEQRADPDLELTELDWSANDDEQSPLMLVTNEGGALLATSFTETQRITPTEEGVEVSAQDGAAILAGVEQSETGIEQTYQLQVLFAVPPADAPEGAQIQVIGYGQALLSADEVEG
ncbi:hypothetical protein [Agrococcus sp. ARC_14]|uniref:hypothetical protein n=1 Tax=Agrococcus sp. ARC_14 TaxID=2919927 RepID=UPI001F05C1DB|nr:hypothetical protein [Agrococcus sp. ARC_14]MCH1882779.1 hypothetical protein [Agrococcus sp. ARC_14]